MAVLNNASARAENSSIDWMTTVEAAEYLDLKPETLEKWRFFEIGPRYYKIGSKRVRYRQLDLDAFIDGGENG